MASNIQIEIAADVQKAVQGIDALVQRLDKMQKETEESKKSFFKQSISTQSSFFLIFFFYCTYIICCIYE